MILVYDFACEAGTKINMEHETSDARERGHT